MNRIEQHPILSVPQDRKMVRFFFNDYELEGYEGEAVSAALIAQGIHEFAIHHKGDTPQGLFCANGQCSHCTLIIDGLPQKSCVTPLKAGMRIQTLRHIPEIPLDKRPFGKHSKKELTCDVLVVGAGPSGITAALELARNGFDVIIVDDKDRPGGKLVLQTHKFFGSIEDCYAGTRGIDIAGLLEKELIENPHIRLFTNTAVIGIFKDQKAGLFIDNKNYSIVAFNGLIVSAGAREKSLIFHGNHLPGVFGAGAFQTLVNRDLVKASQRVFIVGSGNVGLIAAYHALQAGIATVGICDILDKVSGYKVHADKIRRMGVPVYLKHTVISAEGSGKVERVTIAAVDDDYKPLLETARTFEVDTLLIAVGLTPVDEFYEIAKKFNFKVVKAGDADEIAEASSAMFGGRIAALKMANLLGKSAALNATFIRKAEILKSKPGRIFPPKAVTLNDKFQPIIRCHEEIPCNPCTSVCPVKAIRLEGERNDLMDIPVYTGGCTGCMQCVLICPGLAITLTRQIDNNFAEVVLPHEYIPDFKVGDMIALTDTSGNFLENGEVLKIRYMKKYKTHLVHVKATLLNGAAVAGIRVQPEAATAPLPLAQFDYLPDDGIVCHCELVSVKEIRDFIREHDVHDINQLKLARVGMGACGGKNCSVLLPRLFREAGVDWSKVTPGSKRPLSVEVPFYAIANEEDGE
jgi:NADPH-dependent 2,4-dienoyl-CoA reductase/sulfur reductase-like enzyme/Fe-S-cluster-containing hydrogenase component 2/bacterioferritin-associated ferredoxin